MRVKRINGTDGERHAVLVDELGAPLFYPTLWVTVFLRGGSRAVNTIHNALNAIKCLYAWQRAYGIDLEQRFTDGKLLTSSEVHSLRDFLQRPLSTDAVRKQCLPLRARRTVASSSQYARMSVAAAYMDFLAKRVIPQSHNSYVSVDGMVTQIKSNRPNKVTKTIGSGRHEKHLDDYSLDVLDASLRPGADCNPFSEYDVQFRNALIFAILRASGVRRGELLNLKVDDINFADCRLSVRRRPDSPHDQRRYQPVAKTREREIPLSNALVMRIHEYVITYRKKFPASKLHGYLFVTHKRGPYQGAPMSNSAFSKVIDGLKQIVKDAHAHNLRHHWNYSFSTLCTEKGISSAKEEKYRSYLMGWEQNSGTAATYNRRHIEKEAAELVQSYQNKLQREKNGS